MCSPQGQAGGRTRCPQSEWLSQGLVRYRARPSRRSGSSPSSPGCRWGQERAPPPDTERRDLRLSPVSTMRVEGKGRCQDRQGPGLRPLLTERTPSCAPKSHHQDATVSEPASLSLCHLPSGPPLGWIKRRSTEHTGTILRGSPGSPCLTSCCPHNSSHSAFYR